MQPPDSGLLILQASLQLGTKQRPVPEAPAPPAGRRARTVTPRASSMEPVAWGGG